MANVSSALKSGPTTTPDKEICVVILPFLLERCKPIQGAGETDVGLCLDVLCNSFVLLASAEAISPSGALQR